MNAMKLVGMLLLLGGALALMYGVFYATRRRPTDQNRSARAVGEGARKRWSYVPIWAGVGAIVIGELLHVLQGTKRSLVWCANEQTVDATRVPMLRPISFTAKEWPCTSNLSALEARPRGRPRNPGVQHLGHRRPAVARRAPRHMTGAGQLLPRRRKRLGAGDDQPAADHRRPPLGGCGRARRNPSRRRDDSHERRHRRIGAQSRRPDRATAVDARHVECPRAPARRQPGVRGRHAESRVHAAAARRLPDRSGSRRQCDDDHRAQRPGRGLRRRRVVCDRFAPAVSLLREPACATTNMSPRRALDEFDRWSSDRDRRYDTSAPRAMCRRTSSATRISMRTARGATTRATATCGSRIAWPPAGRLTATAIGRGSTRGAGRGSTTRRGASPFPTTAAGRISRGTWGWVPGPGAHPGVLRAGAGRVRGRRQLPACDLGRQRRRRRVVPARAARGLSAVVCGEPRLFRERQPQQHGHQHHGHQQLLQQHRT